MKCPHCLTAYHDHPGYNTIGKDADGEWLLKTDICPACSRNIIWIVNGEMLRTAQGGFAGVKNVKSELLVRPRAAGRPPCPKEVPSDLAKDYNEACLVLPDSATASAALSRRCLQSLLRQTAGVKPGSLADEIQEVLDSGKLPTALADSIDAVRNIGNFAAHPMKSQHTGEILDVEPGEAEWNLDVLESLFDFYFVQPALLRAKRDALNAKLTATGKPPMK
jgi:hypothetical protein